MREVIDIITFYFVPGLIWAGWLEYYTTKYTLGLLDTEWTWKERLVQIFLWPLNLLIFLYYYLKGL